MSIPIYFFEEAIWHFVNQNLRGPALKWVKQKSVNQMLSKIFWIFTIIWLQGSSYQQLRLNTVKVAASLSVHFPHYSGLFLYVQSTLRLSSI